MNVKTLQYSQRLQLGHVVEAGQWNEGDVVFVKSARKQKRDQRSDIYIDIY